MHTITIQTHHLLSELIGADAAAKPGKQRQTALLKSIGAGLAAMAIVAFGGCQQFAGKSGIAAVAQPAAAVQTAADVHDGNWISQTHVQAVKTASDVAVADLSY